MRSTPFHFERREPEAPLSAWVQAVWFARGRIGYQRERIAPTGSTVAVINLGPPIAHATEGGRATQVLARIGWLTGPHDRPSWNEPTGETHAYGVVTTPVGCQRVFGLDPREIRGRVVDLEAWPAGVALRDGLIGLPPRRGLGLLEERLSEGLSPEPARVDRISRAVGWLEAQPSLAVSELAKRLDVTHAHLDREFARIVGLTPRRFAAILRVRAALADLDVSGPPDWSSQALRYGWYDQSHFVRDFKRYTGVTPGAYVAAQREHLSPEERETAAGFVPEGHPPQIKSVQDP